MRYPRERASSEKKISPTIVPEGSNVECSGEEIRSLRSNKVEIGKQGGCNITEERVSERREWSFVVHGTGRSIKEKRKVASI